MRLITRCRERELGQSLVELALVLPVMLVFLAGALDLGRIFYATVSLNNAAREGALQAAATPTSYQEDAACDTTTNLVVCRIQLESKGSMVTVAPTDIDMTCSVSGCPDQALSSVTVEVRGQFRLVTPLLSAVFGGQVINMSSRATAQIEYLPTPLTPTLPPLPQADFTSDYAGPAAPPLTVQFTDTTTGSPNQWMWDLNGDAIVDSNVQNPSYTYTVAGTYNVTLTAINAAGTDIEIKTSYITVNALPSASPSAAPTPTPAPCINIPNVIDMDPNTAFTTLFNAGFTPVGLGTLTTGPKNKVQAQNPDHTQCRVPNTGVSVTYHYRPN